VHASNPALPRPQAYHVVQWCNLRASDDGAAQTVRPTPGARAADTPLLAASSRPANLSRKVLLNT
jgi:hypothetical protein